MKKLFVTILTVILLAETAVLAQTAPVPHNAPRTPVNREALPGHKPLPPNSLVQGNATIIDTEKLRIDDVDLRLFGVVIPQLSASFGPQARAVLDNLSTGQTVSCLVRDRDQGGRYLATCRNSSNTDMALELLRRGLAVTARGSIAATELDTPYVAAEQAAQAQKTGLWSVTIPPAATLMAQKVEAPKVEAAKNEALAPLLPPPPAALDVKAAKTEKAEAKLIADEMQAKASLPVLTASSLAPLDETLAVPEGPGFFARYQLLITGFIMLVTALSILTVVSRQRKQEKRDEMKAIAAALRGELMAARAVCQARLKVSSAEDDDKAMSWPRIRSTLYQAYVGRLGFLGAELARQVASIYGQASDYAAYYNSDDDARTSTAPKKQALQTLIQHIEEVLPKLAQIEQTGVGYISHGFTDGSSWQPVITVQETTPAATETALQSTAHAPLWDSVRKFAHERFNKAASTPNDETDYAALIEEEMAGLSFSEGEDEVTKLPENVTKMRTGS